MASRHWSGGPLPIDPAAKFLVQGFGSSPRARTDRDGKAKLAPSGSATYSTGVKLLAIEGETKAGARIVHAKGTSSVHVTEPADQYGQDAMHPQVYETAGQTWVTPYVSNGFVAYSIVSERLVPYEPKKRGEGDAA